RRRALQRARGGGASAAPRRDQPRRAARRRLVARGRARPRARNRDRGRLRPDLQGRGRRSDPQATRRARLDRPWRQHRRGHRLALRGAPGVSADDTIERVDSEMTEGPLFPASQWAAAAEVLARGAKSDQEQARRLAAALAATGSERAAIYLQIFLTGKLEPRQQLVT